MCSQCEGAGGRGGLLEGVGVWGLHFLIREYQGHIYLAGNDEECAPSKSNTSLSRWETIVKLIISSKEYNRFNCYIFHIQYNTE